MILKQLLGMIRIDEWCVIAFYLCAGGVMLTGYLQWWEWQVFALFGMLGSVMLVLDVMQRAGWLPAAMAEASYQGEHE